MCWRGLKRQPCKQEDIRESEREEGFAAQLPVGLEGGSSLRITRVSPRLGIYFNKLLQYA